MANDSSNKPLATFFVSHGSPRTLVDESPTTEFYLKIAEYAKKEKIQGIVWMGTCCLVCYQEIKHSSTFAKPASHWETLYDTIESK
jgi:aromatic ring-opening dioxygenase catalytic subunit (LigB family)